jgi:hypothetical protein
VHSFRYYREGVHKCIEQNQLPSADITTFEFRTTPTNIWPLQTFRSFIYCTSIFRWWAWVTSQAMFIWLIIRLIQLIFSAGIVFFSHKKSVNDVFQPAYNSSRTGPQCTDLLGEDTLNKDYWTIAPIQYNKNSFFLTFGKVTF